MLSPGKVHARRGLLLLGLLSASYGCAQTIQVRATLDAAQRTPQPSASVFVVESGEGNAGVRKRIASNIRKHLEQSGFRILSEALADYVVFFSFGTEERARPDRKHTGGLMIGSTRAQGVSAPPGWAHYLRIRFFDAERYAHESAPPVLWQVNAELKEKISKNPAAPLELLDLFVVSAFEYFLKDTGRVVEIPGLEAKRIQKGEPR